MPTNLTGTPVTSLIDRAAPPRASPSSLVSTKPDSARRWWNDLAVRTASWPIIASHTKSTFLTLLRSRIWPSSSINTSSTARRPAVSMMTTSRPTEAACCIAMAHRSGGLIPRSEKTGTLSLRPSTMSCWIAAGR